MSFDRGAFLPEFLSEAEERLGRMEALLLGAERGETADGDLASLKREAHTLKGAAAIMGFPELSRAFHRLEDMIEAAWREPARLPSGTAAALLDGLDALARIVRRAGESEDAEADAAALAERLSPELLQAAPPPRQAVQAAPAAAPPSSGPLDSRESEELAAPPAPTPPRGRRVPPPPTRARRRASGGSSSAEGDAAPLSSTPPEAPRGSDQADPAVSRPTVREPADPEAAPAGAAVRVPEPVGDLVRVSTRILDSLMQHATEVRTAHTRLDGHERALRRLIGDLGELATACDGVSERIGRAGQSPADARELERASRDVAERSRRLEQTAKDLVTGYSQDQLHSALASQRLLEEVQAARLVSIATVFDVFPRAVRDQAMRSGKRVRLVVEGSETRLDKSLVEGLREPLTHLIRNAVDHGIEPPAERMALGKPEEGRIRLRAARREGTVVIEIEDDGKGIDPQMIRAKAIGQGLITPTEAEAMSERDLVDLIFLPGFSTQSQVTEISGRGVGMDAVRHMLDFLNGRIEVQTEVHAYTRTVIELPPTVSIVRGLLVKCDGDWYAAPASAVETVTTLEDCGPVARPDGPGAWYKGKAVPVRSLRAVFGLSETRRAEGSPLVILRGPERLTAILVDEVEPQTELVVHGLRGSASVSRLFSGASTLPSGEVALILDVAAVSGSCSRSRPAVLGAGVARVLLVEDERVTRAALERVLTDAGFAVTTARNGLEGLRAAESADFDAVCSDVDMPEMDGVAMVERLRLGWRNARAPVVLVTSQPERDLFDAMRRLGVAARFAKDGLDGDELVAALRDLVGDGESDRLAIGPAGPDAEGR